jgi:hypothetical protein
MNESLDEDRGHVARPFRHVAEIPLLMPTDLFAGTMPALPL